MYSSACFSLISRGNVSSKKCLCTSSVFHEHPSMEKTGSLGFREVPNDSVWNFVVLPGVLTSLSFLSQSRSVVYQLFYRK